MRVVAVWLDGFDIGCAERWRLPTISKLVESSARARLDDGLAHLTGMTGEHVATGLDPSAADRASAVAFDPVEYRAIQRGTEHPPAFGAVDTVVFDPCYFDLDRCPPTVLGLVDWGAHDPGGPRQERPVGLHDEILERFGGDPARRWMYATPWASAERCAQMGADLTDAVEIRSRIARWLLAERLPDWQIAFVGVSEAHSASEGLFHGADPDHPLSDLPSSPAAGQSIRSVYIAIDDLVADMLEAFPDAVHVVFTMHGMGLNGSDVASMVLLGELMRRWSGDATADIPWRPADGVPRLGPDESWSSAVKRSLAGAPPLSQRVRGRLRRTSRHIKTASGRNVPTPAPAGPDERMGWMPLMRHEPHWGGMRAFALPSFYDGRVRLNVEGRESQGIVRREDYAAVLDEIETVLRDCREPITGEPVVAHIDRPFGDPMDVGPWDVDLVVHWAGMPLGLVHLDLGRIGPFPPRRTGGHASPVGACYVHGPGIPAVDLGTRNSFDVLPTVFDLAECESPWPLSGAPLKVPTVT